MILTPIGAHPAPLIRLRLLAMATGRARAAACGRIRAWPYQRGRVLAATLCTLIVAMTLETRSWWGRDLGAAVKVVAGWATLRERPQGR